MSRTIETLTVLESNALLDALLCPYGTSAQKRKAVRNYCIGLLMLDAGLRVGEVTRLLFTDVVLAGEPVKALCVTSDISKSKFDRTIPLSGRLQRAIKNHCNWNRPTDEPGYLCFAFCKPNHRLHISVRQVQRIIKQASIKAIGRAIHPHVLRHTFASRLMRQTSIRVVQVLLGHKQLSSTQVYTHPDSNDLSTAISLVEAASL